MKVWTETNGFDRAVRPGTRRPQHGPFELVMASDVEGPIRIKDAARDIASIFIRPQNPKYNIDYGTLFYDEQHNAIRTAYFDKGLGQPGSDIILSLLPLLLSPATDRDLETEATKSIRTPGSIEHIAHVKSHHSYLVAITTAWRQPHEKLLTQDGFDEIAATEFPIDAIRSRLKTSGAYGREIEGMTANWLEKRVFPLIDKRHEATGDPDQVSAITNQLRETIVSFYRDEIGITWDRFGRTVSSHLTEIGDIIAKSYVVGDREKALVVRRLIRHRLLLPHAPGIIVWADGKNDQLVLGDAEGATWRVAVNGAAAATAANIGVVAADLSKPGIVLTEMFKRYPEQRPSHNQIAKVVFEAQREVGGDALIHVAGPHTPRGILREHDRMQQLVRGERGSKIDHQHFADATVKLS
jgi:hypothetical protein